MGFLALACYLACLLFWGVIIMLLLKSAWLAHILLFILKMTLAFIIIFITLYVIKTIGDHVVDHDDPNSPVDDHPDYQQTDTNHSNQ